MQENGTTLYDLLEFRKDSVVTLRVDRHHTIEEKYIVVQKDTWEETMAGKNESGTDVGLISIRSVRCSCQKHKVENARDSLR